MATALLDIRQLSYFAAVAKCGSFTRAAEELRIAQPAISMAIQKLEKSAGAQLLCRGTTGVTLTNEGQLLLDHAVRILASVAKARSDMDDVRGLVTGASRIGIPPQFVSAALARPMMKFLEAYPGLRMKINDAGSAKLKVLMARGELDLAVLAPDEVDDSLEARHLHSDELVAVAAAGHPVLSAPAIGLSELARHDLALLSEDFLQRRVLDREVSGRNVALNVRLECSHIEVVKAVVRESAMVSTLLLGCVKDDPKLGWRSLEPRVQVGAMLCWRPDQLLSLANKALMEFLLADGVIP